MAEHLVAAYGKGLISVELIPSSGGVFEVEVDDTLVFSKKAEGRFPEHAEVKAKIDAL